MTWRGGFWRPREGAALGLAALIVSCGGGGGDSGTGPNPPPGGTPHPLTVQVTLDDQHAGSATIAPAGGTVTATGADGTSFVLSLPPNALLDPQAITLTPVSAVGNLPLSGGFVAAVQLAPDGLRLLEPATLTIQPPAAFDPRRAMGFGYHADGQEFHLELLSVAGGSATFELTHFSGDGIGMGEAQDVDGVTPSAAEDAARQEMAKVGREAKEHGEVNDADLARIESALRGWYGLAVLPEATAAQTDESRLDAATAWALSWERVVTKSGIEERFAQELVLLKTLLVVGHTNAITQAGKRCVQNHDLAELDKVVSRHKRAILIGLDAYGFNRELANEQIMKCAVFELDFRSDMHNEKFGSKVHSTVKLASPTSNTDPWGVADQLTYFATGPLTFDNIFADVRGNRECSDPVFNPVGSTMQVALVIQFLTTFRSVYINMTVDPGTPSEGGTITCTVGGHTITEPIAPWWLPAFIGFHGADRIPGTDRMPTGYNIPEWTLLYGDVYATKSFMRSQDFGPGIEIENTTLDLKHTPQQ